MAKNKPEKDLRFERFGTKGFTATSKVNDFIDRLEAGQVCGTKCPGCGKRFFPPRADCPDCSGAGPMEWFVVEGEGKLATYSVLRYAPQGFEQDLPYAIAVADYGGLQDLRPSQPFWTGCAAWLRGDHPGAQSARRAGGLRVRAPGRIMA